MVVWERRKAGALLLYQAPAMTGLAGVVQGFTARQGGVSVPPYDSLNLGAHVGDIPADVAANRLRVCDELGFSLQQVALAEQIHGNHVAVVDRGGLISPGADALLTNRPDILLMLFFADCVPVYIVDPAARAIALIHSGWRGTVSGVVQQTVDALRENFGSHPVSCLAAIGPSIGGESYEVGQDVAGLFRDLEYSRSESFLLPKTESAGTYLLNLRQVIYSQLLRAGFQAENVVVSEEDTFRQYQDFFSFRRDGSQTGRMAAFLGLRSL